ncbi:MAG: TIGR03790 family protein [Bryobacterales bacterium]|nr:TIGR03790 family protein [Bryobacterales bacterium]
MMMRRALLTALPWILCTVGCSRGAEDPSSVLILVNDDTMPEPGTGRKGASLYVGEYYAAKRGIPKSNILKLHIKLCCNDDLHDAGNSEISWARFEEDIRQPVMKFLARKGLRDEIHYIVPVYGVPFRMHGTKWKYQGQSVDSFLSSMNAMEDVFGLANPYRARAGQGQKRFRDWTNPDHWKMYIVARLDGPSAMIAAGLVDKALAAEPSLKKSDGIGYFDYRHLSCCAGQPYFDADRTMIDAYTLAKENGYEAVLNDQTHTNGEMIHSAPRTLWAWGWYSGAKSWEDYQFVPGAVGAQLTSYSASSVRTFPAGAWVPLWLRAGITATWGATGEPQATGYAMGDRLLYHFWNGFNFGESAYLSTPYLQHMMVFVGDPLYSPRIFQK